MDLQKQIQLGVQAGAAGARFGLNAIPRHTHNNVDSPYVFQPILTYVGFIPYTGNVINTVLQSLIPKGWTVVYNGTGSYSITHNLNTTLYVVVASAQQSTNQIVSPVIEMFQNSFDVNWFDTNPVAQNTSFTFNLTVIGNRSQTLPTYVGTLTS